MSTHCCRTFRRVVVVVFFYFKTYDQYLISFSDFAILLIKRISTVDILLFGLIGNQNPSGVQFSDFVSH